MTICERMFKFMDDKDIRPSEISSKIGVDISQVGAWRRRNTDPPAKFMVPIAAALGISAHMLMTGEEDPLMELVIELTPSEKKVMEYYRRLDDENKDLIKGEMVRLYKEQNLRTEASDTTSAAI